jgi:putative ABC transport system permease protein
MPWLRRLANTFRSGRLRRDIDRELSFHVAEREDALRAEGLSDDEARRRARLQFGNPAVQIERTRDTDVSAALDGLFRHIRYALRALRRTPGFTATVIVTLALGIGANSAMFSAVNTVLMRSLPYAESGRLVELGESSETAGDTPTSFPRLRDWARLTSTFTAISGHVVEDVSDTTGDVPERISRARVIPGFLTVWGITPALGRGFTEAEHRLGGPPAMLISEAYWRRRFNADPGVLRHTVRMGDRSYPIVGVLPASFAFPGEDVDWWTPELIDAPWAQVRGLRSATGIGRLKSGVTLEQARADLANAQAALAAQYPGPDRAIRPTVVPLKDSVVGGVRRSLWLLFGAVSVLLLIACTNISALLLSRGAARQSEIAVRYALGASRGSVLAQLLTEVAVLAGAGGVAGLAVAAGATTALSALMPDLPRLGEIAVDRRVLLYTAATSTLVVAICGLLPALRASRNTRPAIAGRGDVPGQHSLQWLLVGVQVAMSVTLLSGAGLLLRSLDKLWRVDTGFDASRVLTLRVSGAFGEERDLSRVVARVERTLDALTELPGVTAAATTSNLPGMPLPQAVTSGQNGGFEFRLIEQAGHVEALTADRRVVSPGYFATMRIPIAAGEPCRRTAGATQPVEAVVNETFAERYVPGRSPVGWHLAGDTPNRIIGVVRDVREEGIDRDPGPMVYLCFAATTPFPWYLIRTVGEPASAAAAVRRRIHELEPLRSVYDMQPLDRRIEGAYAENRLRTVGLTLFAATALSLACLGIYGTLSYVVRLRRREVGLRLALGAARSGILRQFIGQGLRVTIAACACGLGLSLLFTRLLSGMLFGVTPSDPSTLAAVIALVLMVSALAALIPATRAALLQPMRILRED